ncbi:MAG: ABC transporter ATP-binding protein [Treponema sp.]|nr:ABC transporter ATP-binding protein [Treponema sp.]
MPLLTVTGLQKRFNLEAGFFARFGRFVTAVNGVSFSIGRNEAYGLVGESGCGKTTTARLLVRMYEPDGGNIVYHNNGGLADVGALDKNRLRQYRQKVKYVFQDPARSLNPRMSILDVLISGLRWNRPENVQGGWGGRQFREKAVSALEEVGLSASDLDRRPSEFSGGQRQRISIARSLLPQPELLICDEVVSALDVSIQAQILNLLLDIREKRNGENRAMAFLFIAHDLKVACYFCDRIGVMYSGELMEEAPAADLWREGRHPYTKMLFASATGMKSPAAPLPAKTTAENEAENSSAPCCAFAPRCKEAVKRCFLEPPPLVQISEGHAMRCHCGR